MTEAEYNALHSSRRRYLASASGSTSVSLTNQQSGGSIGTIYVALTDQFGQVVSSDNSSSATLSIVGTYSGAAYTPTLTGTSKVTALNGAYKFTGITFTAKPGVSYSLSLTTTGIDPSKPSNAAYLSSNSKSSTAMDFTISLRACIAGEAFISTGACKACKAETEYSLSSLSGEGDCKSCQTKRMY